MTDDLENSGQWRDRVESRLSTLEARVDEEARLRAAMDSDLSGARADRKMLQSLHDTQSDHTAKLKKLGEGVDELRRGHQKILAGIDVITSKLDSLIDSGT